MITPITQDWTKQHIIDSLVMQPGLTYGRAITNLTHQVEKSKKNLLNKIICALAIVVALAVAIAILVCNRIFISPLFDLSVRTERITSSILNCTFTVASAIFGVIFGSMSTVVTKDYFPIDYFYLSTAKTIQHFSKFENDATMENSDLKKMLDECNEEVLTWQILSMNFEQLTITRDVLGSHKFKLLAYDAYLKREEYQKIPLELWQMILFCPVEDSEDYLNDPNSDHAIRSLIKTSPLYAKELKQALKDAHSPWLDDLPDLLSLQHPGVDGPQHLLTFTCENQFPIQIDMTLLAARSIHFKNMFNDLGFEESEENIIEIIPEMYGAFNLYTEALIAEDFELTQDNVLQLIECADYYDDQLLKNDLEKYIIANRSFFAKEILDDLIEQLDFKLLRMLKDNQLCKIKLTNENWDELATLAQKFQTPNLIRKMQNCEGIISVGEIIELAAVPVK